MRTVMLTVAAFVLLVLAASAEEPKKKDKAVTPREIDKGTLAVKTDGDVAKPARLTDEKTLAAAIPDKGRRNGILEEVNFDKQDVLYFEWSGVVSDRLTHKVEKGKKGQVVVFTYTAGETEDRARTRYRVFVIGKDDTFRVETAK